MAGKHYMHIVSLWLGFAGRGVYVIFLDLISFFLAAYLGFALRFTLFIFPRYRPSALVAAVVFTALNVLFFWLGGVYRIYWPQASVEEYASLARWYFFSAAAFLMVDRFWSGLFIPRSSLAIMLLSGILLCCIFRASWRFFLAAGHKAQRSVRTLIAGAGEAGSMLARDLLRHGEELMPLGFVDDDARKQGKVIAGLRVLGSFSDLPSIVREKNIRVVLVAIPSLSSRVTRHVFDILTPLGVEVRVLPNIKEIANGRVTMSHLRDISLEDLLCREPISLDLDVINDVIRGRVVLVTGAGGSIGSEIARQLLSYGPRKLLLLGHGEHSIYTLMEEIGTGDAAVSIHPIIADVADVDAMKRIFDSYCPDIVFHAAAHKHVPLMELNPKEALRVNSLGTTVVGRLCGIHGVERMVMISTDKAVNPTSVMGATKRLAEMSMMKLQEKFPSTSYMAVRFGNVLGSRGSVVPKFEKQIERGGPVTVTHPDMRRYFMLIPEAASLVLQAGALGRGGELFVLDMGEPVRILDLAETLIRLHGYQPNREIPIEFSGVRPGEKLFEELFYDPGHVEDTVHEKIFRARLSQKENRDDVFSFIDNIPELDAGEAISALKEVVPEFEHE